MSSHVAKLATAGSFGIALLGLYFIFNSTSVQLSLSACAMYIVGTVVGVILIQSISEWRARPPRIQRWDPEIDAPFEFVGVLALANVSGNGVY